MSSADDLVHFGVKGMHWGVRRRRSSAPKRMSTESKRAEQVHNKFKEHGRKSLTNKELNDYNKRLELERKFNQLVPQKQSVLKMGHDHTKQLLAIGATANAVIAFSYSPAGRALAKKLGKKVVEETTG